jgi:hypothetical protein
VLLRNAPQEKKPQKKLMHFGCTLKIGVPSTTNGISKTVLFAEDTCITIYKPDDNSFVKLSNGIFTLLKKWFVANK